MTSIFLQDPVYITIQEVKDSTTKTGILALTDSQIKILITKAQDIIDNYIISYGVKFDENQEYIFPIDLDGVSTLPLDIKKACLYTVEQLFVSGDLINGAVSTTSGGAITQEKVGDRSVSYSTDSTTTTNNQLKFLGIPPEAEIILKKYRTLFIKNII